VLGLPLAFLGVDTFGQSCTPAPGEVEPKGRPLANVRDHGARGDGSHDDGPAIRAAMVDANKLGGTVLFPPGTYNYHATGPLVPTSNVSLVGSPGASIINIRAAAYTPFLISGGKNVAMTDLTVSREADFPCVMVIARPFSGLTLQSVSLHGNQGRYPSHYCHGLQLGLEDSGMTSAISLLSCKITTMSYGLLQTNESRATVTKIFVSDCLFTGNINNSLEFNSPSGAISSVTVEKSRFLNGQGFAIGVAHCDDVQLHDNSFENFTLEAIHIEDYSNNVVVADNVFTSCGLHGDSHVQVISGSHAIRIERNTFHATMNTEPIACVNVLAGGTGPTAGGRPAAPPSNVAVEGNTFEGGREASGIYFGEVSGGLISGNELTNETTAGVANPLPEQFRVQGGEGIVVHDNQVNGKNY